MSLCTSVCVPADLFFLFLLCYLYVVIACIIRARRFFNESEHVLVYIQILIFSIWASTQLRPGEDERAIRGNDQGLFSRVHGCCYVTADVVDSSCVCIVLYFFCDERQLKHKAHSPDTQVKPEQYAVHSQGVVVAHFPLCKSDKFHSVWVHYQSWS